MTVSGGTGAPKVVLGTLINGVFTASGFEQSMELYEPFEGVTLYAPDLTVTYDDQGEIYEDIEGIIRSVDNGVRPLLSMVFDGVNKAGHAAVTAMRNHKLAGGIFRVYPHEDETEIWYLCRLVEADTEKKLGQRYALGYGPVSLIFTCLGRINVIPVDIDYGHWSLVGGVYDATDDICHWSLVGGTYDLTDIISHWASAGIYISNIDGYDVQYAQIN